MRNDALSILKGKSIEHPFSIMLSSPSMVTYRIANMLEANPSETKQIADEQATICGRADYNASG